MPFSGSEILEVSVGTPDTGCVVGDYIVSIDGGRSSPSGVLPLTGSFSVMNTLTGASHVYTGLPNTIRAANVFQDCCEGGGYAWFFRGTAVYRITPSTGAVSLLSAPGVSPTGIAYLPGMVYLTPAGAPMRMYDIASGLWSSGTGNTAANARAPLGVAGHVIVGVGNSSSSQLFDAAGVLLGTIATGGASPGNRTQACSIGTKAYYGTQPNASGTPRIDVYDVISLSGSQLPMPAGSRMGNNLAVGDDGWIYTYDYNVGQIVAISPVTGAGDTGAPPTVRARRYCVFAANGELWVPSGDPF